MAAAGGGSAVAEALTHLRQDLQQALTKASTGLAALATTTSATNAAISKSHNLSSATRQRPEDHSSGGLLPSPLTPPGVCTPEGGLGEVESSSILHQGVSSPDHPSKNEQGSGSSGGLSSLFSPLYPSAASSKQESTSFAEDLSSRSTESPPLSELERQPAETVECRIEKSHGISVQTSGLPSSQNEGTGRREEQAREQRVENQSDGERKGVASGAKSVFSLSSCTTAAVDPTYVREGGGGKNIEEEAEERFSGKSGEEKKTPEKSRRRYFFPSPDKKILQGGPKSIFYYPPQDPSLPYLPRTSSSFSSSSSYSLDIHTNKQLSSSFLPSPSPPSSCRVPKKEKLSSYHEALSASQKDFSLTRKRIGTSTGCCSLVSSPCSPALRLSSFSSSPSLALSTEEKLQAKISQKEEGEAEALFRRQTEEEENRRTKKYIWGSASTSRLDEAENAWFFVDLLEGSDSGGLLEKMMEMPPSLSSSSSLSPDVHSSPWASSYHQTQDVLLKTEREETTYALPLTSERRRREEEEGGGQRMEEREEETLHFSSSSYQDLVSSEKTKTQKGEDKKNPSGVLSGAVDSNRARSQGGGEEEEEGREMPDLLSRGDVMSGGVGEEGNVYMRKEITSDHQAQEESNQVKVNEAEERDENSLDQENNQQPGASHSRRRGQEEGEEREGGGGGERTYVLSSSSSEFIDLSSSLPPSLIASTVMSECLAGSVTSLESHVSTTRGGEEEEEEEDLSASFPYGEEKLLRKEEEEVRDNSVTELKSKKDSRERGSPAVVGGLEEGRAKRCIEEEDRLVRERRRTDGEKEGENKNLFSLSCLSQARHSESEEPSLVQEHLSPDAKDDDKPPCISSSTSPLRPAAPLVESALFSSSSSCASSVVRLSSSPPCAPLCSVDDAEGKRHSFAPSQQPNPLSSSSSLSLRAPLLQTSSACSSSSSPAAASLVFLERRMFESAVGRSPPGEIASGSQSNSHNNTNNNTTNNNNSSNSRNTSNSNSPGSYRNSGGGRSILPVSFFPALTSLTFSPSFLFKKKPTVDLDEDLEACSSSSSHSSSPTREERRREGRAEARGRDEASGETCVALSSDAPYRGGVREGRNYRRTTGGQRRHHMKKAEGSTSFASLESMMDFVRNSIALYGQSALEGVVFLVPAEDAEELVVALEESIPYSWRDVEHAALEALKPLTAMVVGRLILVELPAMVAEVLSLGASTESAAAAAAATTTATIEASGVLSTALSLAPWLIVLGGCVYAIVRSAKALQASRRSHLLIETLESLPNERREREDWNLSQGRNRRGEGDRRRRSASNEGRRRREEEERRAVGGSRYDREDPEATPEERRTRDERSRRRGRGGGRRDRRDFSLDGLYAESDGYRRIPEDLILENEEEQEKTGLCQREDLEGTAWREDHTFLTVNNEAELCSIQWRGGGGGDLLLLPPLEV